LSVASSVAYARERERVLRICDAAGVSRTVALHRNTDGRRDV